MWHDLTETFKVEKGQWGWQAKIGYSDTGETGPGNPCIVLTRTKNGLPQFRQQVYLGKEFWEGVFKPREGVIARALNQFETTPIPKKK